MALLSPGARPLVEVASADPSRLLDALAGALDGTGPAVLPRGVAGGPAGDPVPASLDRTWPADACLVIETSGSTARPKRVVLEASALRASARATDVRFDALRGVAPRDRGGGEVSRQWLLALPGEYVAGAQVLVRSLLAGTTPVVTGRRGFDVPTFVADAERMHADRRYVSLVPAQLIRLLDAATAGDGRSDDVAAVVARFDAVLVGGQALPPSVRSRAEALGWAIVASYGSSETSGGCAYDGAPLDGVTAIAHDGEILIGGPVLAAGYLGDRERTDRSFVLDDRGFRWYRTGDGGEVVPRHGVDPDWVTGRIRVTGRLDSVIVSGGEKVLLDRVERAVRRVPGLEQGVVVAAPSRAWGEVPALVVNATDLRRAGCAVPDLPVDGTLHEVGSSDRDAWAAWHGLRDAAAVEGGRAARPAHLFAIDGMPHLSSGKPDRVVLTGLVAAALRS